MERMRQGPGRGGKDDPTGTLDLLAQDLRTWLRKKKAERGRAPRTLRRKHADAPPPPVPPARRFCQELRQERPTPSDFGAEHIQKLQAQKDFVGLVAGIRKRSFDVGLALTALGRLLAGPEGGDNVAPAWRAGAIEATLEAMEQHAHDHRVVLPACKVLGACTVLRGISHVAVTENAAVCADIVKHGGIALLVAAYGALADDEEMEGVVLEPLNNLGALEDPVTMEMTASKAAAEFAVACKDLGLGSGFESQCKDVHKHGDGALLLAAVEAFEGDGKMVQVVLETLQSLWSLPARLEEMTKSQAAVVAQQPEGDPGEALDDRIGSTACFHPSALVRMADGSFKPVGDLCAGDAVAPAEAGARAPRVRCVVKTDTLNGTEQMTALNGGKLVITPWHPVLEGAEWAFPADVAAPQETACTHVVSVVLDGGHSLEVGGLQCVTLGHGMVSNAVTNHPYYATERVLRDLEQMPGFASGLLHFRHGSVRRGGDGRVVGFDASRLYSAASKGTMREMSTVSIKRDREGRVGLYFLRPNRASSGPFEITSLVPRGAADQSRAVQVADMFSAVNGQDVSSLSDAAVAVLCKGPPSVSLTLSLCAKAQSTPGTAFESTSRDVEASDCAAQEAVRRERSTRENGLCTCVCVCVCVNRVGRDRGGGAPPRVQGKRQEAGNARARKRTW